MAADDLLRMRLAERQELLDRAVELLKTDGRVVAAWLHGSMGRGTADE
jgi:predicted nucleotidyltransferase